MKAYRIIPIAALFAAGLANATPVTGTINFSGSVTAAPCTVDTSTDSTGLGQTVTLPTANVTDFSTVGSTYGATSFKLGFTGCTAAAVTSGVKLTFGGTADSNVASTFAIATGSGNATGISFQLLNGSGTAITPNTTANYAIAATGANTLSFTVQYYETLATIAAGSATAAVPVTVVFP